MGIFLNCKHVSWSDLLRTILGKVFFEDRFHKILCCMQHTALYLTKKNIKLEEITFITSEWINKKTLNILLPWASRFYQTKRVHLKDKTNLLCMVMKFLLSSTSWHNFMDVYKFLKRIHRSITYELSA